MENTVVICSGGEEKDSIVCRGRSRGPLAKVTAVGGGGEGELEGSWRETGGGSRDSAWGWTKSWKEGLAEGGVKFESFGGGNGGLVSHERFQ